MSSRIQSPKQTNKENRFPFSSKQIGVHINVFHYSIQARLKNSGLKDRIYLVESYYSHNNRDLYEQQIQTSQVEIMLLDDCHLQSTADWSESVEYLVMRTNVLNQLHQVCVQLQIPRPISYISLTFSSLPF